MQEELNLPISNLQVSENSLFLEYNRALNSGSSLGQDFVKTPIQIVKEIGSQNAKDILNFSMPTSYLTSSLVSALEKSSF